MAAEVDNKELRQATEKKEERGYIRSEQLERIANEYFPDEFQKIEEGSDKPSQATENLENAEKKQPECSIRDTLHSINRSNDEISDGESFLASPSSAEVVYKTNGMSVYSHAGEMTFGAATYNLETEKNVDVIEELSRKRESDSQKDLDSSELDTKGDLNMPSRLGENVETEMSICSKNDLTHSIACMNDAPTVVTKDVLGKHESGLHKVIEQEETPSIGIQCIIESTQQMEITMPDEDETKTDSDPSNFYVGETEGQSLHQEGNSDAIKVAAEIRSGKEVSEIKMNKGEADDLFAGKAVQVHSTYKEKNDNFVPSPFMTQEEKIQSQNENLTGADTSEARYSSGEYGACIDKERHTEDEACKSTGLVPEHPLTKEDFQKETIGNAAEGDTYGDIETEAEASVEIYSKESEDKKDKCSEKVAFQKEPLELDGVNERNHKDCENSMRLEKIDALSTDLTQASNEENANMIFTDNERTEDKCKSFNSKPDGGDELSKETDQTHDNSERSSTYMNKQKEIHGECMEQTCFEASIGKQEKQEPVILLPEESIRDAELSEVEEENEVERSNDEYRPENSLDENESKEKLSMLSAEISEESEAHTFGLNAHQAEKEEYNNSTKENKIYEKGEQVTAPADVHEKEIKVEKDDNASDNQPKHFQAAELIEGCSRETSQLRKEDNLMESEIKEVQKNIVNEDMQHMDAYHTVAVSNPEIKIEAESSDTVAGDNAPQANEEQGKPSTNVSIDMKQDDASNIGKQNDMESSVMDAAEGRMDRKMLEVVLDAEPEEYKELDIIEKLSKDTLQENLEETSTLKAQEYKFPNAETTEAVNKTSEKDGSIHQIGESTLVTNGVDEVPIQKEDNLKEAKYVTECELLENATETIKVQEREDFLYPKVDFVNESKSAEVLREETREIADCTEVCQLNPLSGNFATLEADNAEEESSDSMKYIATFEATAHVEKDPDSKLEEHKEPEKEECNTEANAQTTQEYDRNVKEVDKSDISLTVENKKQTGGLDISEALNTSSIQVEDAEARTAEQREQNTKMLPQSTLAVLLADEPSNRNTNNTEQVEEDNVKEMQQNKSLEIPPTGAVEGTCMNGEDLKKDGVTSKALAKEVQKDPPEDEGKGHTTNEVSTMDPQEKTGMRESQEISLASEENKEQSVETKENSALLEQCGTTSTVLSEIRESEVSKASARDVADSTTFAKVTTDCEPEKQFLAINEATETALKISNEKENEEQENDGDKKEVQEQMTKEAKEVDEISHATSKVTEETIPGSLPADNAEATSLQEQTSALAAECEKTSPDKSDTHGSITSRETEKPDAGMKITDKTGICYDANIGVTMTAETIENKSEVCFEKEETRQHEASNVEIPLVTESSTGNGCEGEDRTTMGSHKAEPQVEELVQETEICIESNGSNEATHSNEQIKKRNVESTEEATWQIQSHEEKVLELTTITAKDPAEDIKEDIPSDSDSHDKTDAKVEEGHTRTKEHNQESSDENRKKINTFDGALKPESPKEATVVKCYDSSSDIEEKAEPCTAISERLSLESPAGKGKENLNLESGLVDVIEKCEKATESRDDACNEISNEEIDVEHGEHNEIGDLKENRMEEAGSTKDIQETLPANSLVGKGRDSGSVSSEFSETTEEICIRKGEPGASTTSEGETKANSNRRDAPHENQNEVNINIEAQPETQEQEVTEMQCDDQTAIHQENTDPVTQRGEVLKFLSDNSKAECHGASESQPRETLMEAGTENAETKFLNTDSKPVDFEPEKDNEMELIRNDFAGDTIGDDAIAKEVNAGQGKQNEIASSNEKQKDEADDANEVQETPTISKERDIKLTSIAYGKVTAEVCINREEKNEHKLPEILTEDNQGNYFTSKESEEEANIQNKAPEARPQDVSATNYIESTDFYQQNMDVSKETKKSSDIMVEKSEPEIPSHGSMTGAIPTDAKRDNLNSELETSRSDLESPSMKRIDGNDATCYETSDGGVHVAHEKVDETKYVEEHDNEEVKGKDIHVILPTNSAINKERDSIAEHSEATGETWVKGVPGASQCGTENNSNEMNFLDEDQNEGKVEERSPKPQFQEQEVSEMICADFPNISEDVDTSTQIEEVSNLRVEQCEIKSEVTSKDQSHDSLTGGPTDAEIKSLNVESELVENEHEKQCEIEIVKEYSSIGEAADKEDHAAFEEDGEIEIKKDINAEAANIDETIIYKEKDILSGSTKQSEVSEAKCIKDQESSASTVLKCDPEESRDKTAIMNEDQDDSQIEHQVTKEEPQEQELNEIRGVVSSQVSQENAQPCAMLDKESDSMLHKSARVCQLGERRTLSEDAELKNPNVESKSVDIVPVLIAAGEKDEMGDEKADESESTKEHNLESSSDVIDVLVNDNSPEVAQNNLVLSQDGDNIAEHNESTGETGIEIEPIASECERDILNNDQNEGNVEEGCPKPQFREPEVSEMTHADFLNISEEDVESSTQTKKVSELASEKSKIKSKDQSHDFLKGGSKDAEIKSLNIESKLVDIEHERQCEIETVEEYSSIGEAYDKEVHAAFEKASEIEKKKDIDAAATNIDATTICKERDIFPKSIEQSATIEGRCIKNQESSTFAMSKCKIEECGDKTTIMTEDQDEGQIEDQRIKEETQEQELSEIRVALSSQVSQENAQPCAMQDKEYQCMSHKSAAECQLGESIKGTLLEDADVKNPNAESKSVDIVPALIAAEDEDNNKDEMGDGKADERETTKELKLESSGYMIDEVLGDSSPEVEGNNSVLSLERDSIAEHNETTGETCMEKEPSASECETEDTSNKRDVLDEDLNEGKDEEEGPKPQFQEQEVSEMKHADFLNISKKDAESSTNIEKVSDLAFKKSKIKPEGACEDQSYDILTGLKDAEMKTLNEESKLVDIEHEKQCEIEIVKEYSSISEASDKEVHATFGKAGEIEINKDIDAAASNIDVTTICEEGDFFSESTEQSEVTEGKGIKNQEPSEFATSKCKIDESGDKTTILDEDQDEGEVENEGRIKEVPQEQELCEIRGVVASQVSQEDAQICTTPDKESEHVLHKSAPKFQPHEGLKGTLLEDAELKSPHVESKSADIWIAEMAAEEKNNNKDEEGDGFANESVTTKEHKLKSSGEVIDKVVGDNSLEVVGNNSVLNQEGDNIAEHNEMPRKTCIGKEPSTSECETDDNSNKRDDLDEDQNEGKVEEEGPKPQFQEQEVSEMKQADFLNISKEKAESRTQKDHVSDLASEKTTIKYAVTSEDQSHDILTKGPKDAEIENLNIGSKLVGIEPEKECAIEIVKEDISIDEASNKEVQAAFEKAGEIEIKKNIDAADTNIDVPTICKEGDIFSGSTEQSEVTKRKCEIEKSGDKIVIMSEDHDEGQIQVQGIKEEPEEQELRGVVSSQVSQENAQPCAMLFKESCCKLHKSATEYQPGESLKGTLSEDAELKSLNVESESVDIVPAVIATEEKDNKQDDTGDGNTNGSENPKVRTIENSCGVIDEVVGDNSPKMERDIFSVSAEFVEEQCVNNRHPIAQQQPNLTTDANGDSKETINEDEEKGYVQNEIMEPKSLGEVTETKQSNSQKNSQDNLGSSTQMEKVSNLLAYESETCKAASEVLSYKVLTEAGSEYSESKHLDTASEVVGERNNITPAETPHEEVSGELVKSNETDHTKECDAEKTSDAIEIHPVLTRDTPIAKEDTSLVVIEHAEALDLGEEKKAGNSIHASTAEVKEKEKPHDEQNGISMEPVKPPQEDEKEIKEEIGSSRDDKHAASSTKEATEAVSLETQEDEDHMQVQDPVINDTKFFEAERTDTSLRIMKEEAMVGNISLKTIPEHLIQCENTEKDSVEVQPPAKPIHQAEDPGAKAMDIAERAISQEKLETERENATTYSETVVTVPQDGKLLIGGKITSETSPIKDLQADVKSQTMATTMVSDEKECQNIEDANRVEDAIQGKESLEAPLKKKEEYEDAQDILIKEDKKEGSIPSDVPKPENQEKEKNKKGAFPSSVEQQTESTTLTEDASMLILGEITKACDISGNEVSDRQEEEIPNKNLPDEAEPDIRNQDSKTPVERIMVEAPAIKEEVSSAEYFQKKASLNHEEENRIIPDRELQVKNTVEAPSGEILKKSPLHKETIVSTDNENVSPNLKDRFSETLEKVEGNKNLTEVNSAVEQVEQGGEVGKQSLSGNAKGNPMSADTSFTSFSDLLQKSTKDTLQMVKELAEKKEPEAKLELQNQETEAIEHEEMKTDELGEDESRETETGQNAPLLAENTKDVDIKVPHKKSHNILSGVGSKVKHSISKVRKVITGKSSHSKTAHSPK